MTETLRQDNDVEHYQELRSGTVTVDVDNHCVFEYTDESFIEESMLCGEADRSCVTDDGAGVRCAGRLAALSFSKGESCLEHPYAYMDLDFYRVWIESRGAEYDEDRDYDNVSKDMKRNYFSRLFFLDSELLEFR